MLMTRRRLLALGASLAVCAAGLGEAIANNPLQHAVARNDAAGYPTIDEVRSFNFMLSSYEDRVAAGDNPKLVFGSSELNPTPLGDSSLSRIFSGGALGMDIMTVGRAQCTDIWQALEVGAFADHMVDRRVVIIPSMQWFMCYRDPAGDFSAVYSSDAYEACMDSSWLSDGLRDRLAARVEAYGQGEAAHGPQALIDAVDAAAARFQTDFRLGSDIMRETSAGKDAAGDDEASSSSMLATGSAPDWDALIADGQKRARAQSTNDYGVRDDWFANELPAWIRSTKRWRFANREPFSSQELEDLQMTLDVCREARLKPLVIIQPVKGALYDATVYTADVRATYYDMVRSACEDGGVDVADFSDHEYDTYFLRDYLHPSEEGAAWYARAIWEFFSR